MAQAECGHGKRESPFSAWLPVLDHCKCWSMETAAILFVICLSVLPVVMFSVACWKYFYYPSCQEGSAYFGDGRSWVVFWCRGSKGSMICANPSEKIACRKPDVGLAFSAVFVCVLWLCGSAMLTFVFCWIAAAYLCRWKIMLVESACSVNGWCSPQGFKDVLVEDKAESWRWVISCRCSASRQCVELKIYSCGWLWRWS